MNFINKNYSNLIHIFLIATSSLSGSSLLAHYPLKGNLVDNVSGKVGKNYGCIIEEDRFGNPYSSYRIWDTKTWLNIPASDIFNKRKTYTMTLWMKK